MTTARGAAGPAVAWLLLTPGWSYIAFWVFAGAALTDLFDGWLAKSSGQKNPIGRWLDPLADMILVCCAWVALWAIGWAPWWLVIPSLARAFIITVAWLEFVRRDIKVPPSSWGQVRASFEGTAIGILLFHGPWGVVHWPAVGVAVGMLSLALSVASLIGYIIDGWRTRS